MSITGAVIKGIYDVFYHKINEDELREYVETGKDVPSLQYLVLDLPQKELQKLVDYLNSDGDNITIEDIDKAIDDDWENLADFVSPGMPDIYRQAYERLSKHGY